MQRKERWRILLLAGVIFVTLGNSVGMAQRSSGGPPQETIAACYLQEWSLRFYSKMPFHSFYDFVFFHRSETFASTRIPNLIMKF
jgi:hypothetical protein